jgi:hypothetical protein
MRNVIHYVSLSIMLTIAALAGTTRPGEIIAAAKARDSVRCGVSTGLPASPSPTAQATGPASLPISVADWPPTCSAMATNGQTSHAATRSCGLDNILPYRLLNARNQAKEKTMA